MLDSFHPILEAWGLYGACVCEILDKCRSVQCRRRFRQTLPLVEYKPIDESSLGVSVKD
jgi:hypothetical protein